MLVLSRGIGETIHIGTDVKLTVVSTGKRVKVGIEAPREIKILRGEIRATQEQQTPEGPDVDERRRPRFAVLLVEDNPVHAKIVTHTLRRESGSDVTVVSSGEEAIRSLSISDDVERFAGVPNLILLDLRLPGMSGLDVLLKIKSDPDLRKTPVVILSSTDDPFEIEGCLNAGANAFVTKSPDHNEFRSSLSRIADFWASASQTPGRLSVS